MNNVRIVARKLAPGEYTGGGKGQDVKIAKNLAMAAAVAAIVLFAAGLVHADVRNMGGVRNPVTGTWTGLASLETVHIGDPGNKADPDTPMWGAVAYPYEIGKYEVTAGQYCVFLNAVAKTDTYGLYSTAMDTSVSAYGCSIIRTGSSGGYAYSVASDWANRPVNYVSWGTAARFSNWLTNGQPSGIEGLSTTEDGSYYLNGATSNSALLAVTRIAEGQMAPGKEYYFIPNFSEWHKAAYFDPHKAGGAGFWNYPTGTDSAPSNVFSSTGTNNANFAASSVIMAPHYRTEVGAYASSPSPCGTFDQAGNVWEWTEGITAEGRMLRGGAFNSSGDERFVPYLVNNQYDHMSPSFSDSDIGFRIVELPEPATLSLLALGGMAALIRRRRKRSAECGAR